MNATTRRAPRVHPAFVWGAIAAVAFIVCSTVVSTRALGYWSSPAGRGGGNGSLTTTQQVTLTPGTGAADLLPGKTGTVVTVATNPSQVSVHVVGITLDTTQGANGFAVDTAHSGCATSVLSFADQSNGGSGWNVAGGATATISMAGSLSMTTAAAAACQGATITVYLQASQ